MLVTRITYNSGFRIQAASKTRPSVESIFIYQFRHNVHFDKYVVIMYKNLTNFAARYTMNMTL